MARPRRPQRAKPTPQTERLGNKVTRGTRRVDLMLPPELTKLLKAVAEGHNHELFESGVVVKGRIANLSHLVRAAIVEYIAAHRDEWIEKGWLMPDGSPPNADRGDSR